MAIIKSMKAIITGGTKGIGRAIAFKFASEGFDLAICARTESDLMALAEELKSYDVQVLVFKADFSQKEQVLSFCDFVLSHWIEIDVLVNNVGVFCPVNFLEESFENFEKQLSTNLSASYYTSKIFGNKMKLAQKGHIFNIVSVNSLKNQQQGRSYGVTKSAMLSLNDVTREQLAPFKVKVTAILPGETFTNSWAGTEILEERFVQATEIAEMISSIYKLGPNTQVDELIIKPLNF